MKIALGLEYQGTLFHGWQKQQKYLTLQATLEMAISKVAAHPVEITCAGRTDAGVHATNQVIHFETHSHRDFMAWVMGTNSYLPKAMSIQWAREVNEEFHARFSALSRRYQYFIYNYPIRSSLLDSLTAWVRYPLDETKMHLAAQALVGEHDFTSFRSADCQSKTPKRHIFAVKVVRQKEIIVVDIVANSFLHHMVRNIVGALIEIGRHRKETSWCRALLGLKNRNLAAKTAAPEGLYLTGVQYPDSYDLPSLFRSPSLLSLGQLA